MKILVVEDEGVVAVNAKMFIKSLGHDVVGTTENGETALEMIKSNMPDLIFMDIVLQGDLSGIETTEIINSKYEIPVVYMTASTDKRSIERASRTRHYGFLHKPFEVSQLKGIINKLMAEKA